MVTQGASGRANLPDMMTSIRITSSGEVEIVDQLLLPHTVKWEKVETPEEAFDAIKSMKIRGAPAIASLAALSLRSYLTTKSYSSIGEAQEDIRRICDYLQSSRPTAVNLGEAMNRIRFVVGQETDLAVLVSKVRETCWNVHEEDLERNMAMGRHGAEWLWAKRRGKGALQKLDDKIGHLVLDGEPNGKAQDEEEPRKLKVITVCNTGSLATSGYGTAIGVITALYQADQLDTAYYAQTAPYHQGSRLTSLELTTLRIPACMICDNMLGSLMQHNDIDAVIVGADRVVRNGDTANKIGTYQAAVLAARHNVPFMVVAPVTTIDLDLADGKEILIERRPGIEATQIRGRNVETGELSVVRITPEGVGEGQEIWQQVYNPAFDVTPAELISCVVTEKGVAERSEGADNISVASVC